MKNLILKIFEKSVMGFFFFVGGKCKIGGEVERREKNEIGESDDQCSLCSRVEYLQKCKLATAT